MSAADADAVPAADPATAAIAAQDEAPAAAESAVEVSNAHQAPGAEAVVSKEEDESAAPQEPAAEAIAEAQTDAQQAEVPRHDGEVAVESATEAAAPAVEPEVEVVSEAPQQDGAAPAATIAAPEEAASSTAAPTEANKAADQTKAVTGKRKRGDENGEQGTVTGTGTGLQSLLSAIEMDMHKREDESTGGAVAAAPEAVVPAALPIEEHGQVHPGEVEAMLSTTFDKVEELEHGVVQPAAHELTEAQALDHDQYMHEMQQHTVADPAMDESTMEMPLHDWTRRRKWSGFDSRWEDAEARQARIKQVVDENLTYLMDSAERQLFGVPAHAGRITTISCAYAAVGQKSYGHERRYMTPPPYCVISGPSRALLGDYPQVFMSIHSEEGVAAATQEERLDRNCQAFFKQLHINSATVGKSKSFHLKLQIGTKNSYGPMDIPFAEFDTPEISIISKASSRTSKLRLQNATIYHDSPISLYNRINSQTVRTKYLNLEENQMTVRSESWAPFFIQLVDENTSPIDPSGRRPILYGSQVTLYDPNTGSRSERMNVRRLHKNELDERTAGAVSQMQKIILERAVEDGQPSAFLSASSAQRMQKDPNTGVSEVDPFTHWMPVDMNSNTIEVDDHVCWTLMGISQIQCSFLDTLSDEPTEPVPDTMPDVPRQRPRKRRKNGAPDDGTDPTNGGSSTPGGSAVGPGAGGAAAAAGPGASTPTNDDYLIESHVQVPVTPFPTLADRPAFDANTARLFLVVRNFLQPGSEVDSHEVWLGATGPMKICSQQLLHDTDTDVSLELEMPTLSSSDTEAQKLPLLFVRPDGLVLNAGCDLIIRAM